MTGTMKTLNRALKSQNGFTLVELLISTVLTLSLLGSVYGVYKVQARNLKVQDDRLAAQEYARTVVDLMVREIRNAGFAPNGGGCGVFEARTQLVEFSYDANGNGVCTVAEANEVIMYSFDVAGCPNGFGNIMRRDGVNSQALTDCNVPTGAANFSFHYFQQNSAAALTTPVVAPTSIQRVRVSLTIQSKNPDPEFGGQLTATMTSNADLRNRGLPAS